MAASKLTVSPSTATSPDIAPPVSSPGPALSHAAFITEYDRYLLHEGTHLRLYEKLGAHPIEQTGINGVHFAVWAPNASRVSVVGDFNSWDGNRNAMYPSDIGLWTVFIPGLNPGAVYKYEIADRDGHLLPLKADPVAFAAEHPPATASRICALPPAPPDIAIPQTYRDAVSIYEVHLGSWRRGDNNSYLDYAALSATLIPYVKDMGFTHIELMPVSEYPFDGSWGYQPTGLFTPTSRFGDPAGFAAFVAHAHREGIGIITDWVPGHFPADSHALGVFDGTHLYEYADPREGRHMDWDTLIYNYGRNEVANFLIANALFWLDRYGIDGLRFDAVASMLYRNYSRKPGEWIPNHFGGVENLEAVAFLRKLNEEISARFPGRATYAEESTAWPNVSRPVSNGGLGFTYKWNMGWMHDTLLYMAKDPIYRRHEHQLMTFGLVYAWNENFVLPLSHDEVVHGKKSMLEKMPGDDWQKFANLRAYYGFMFGHPGKKLLFMGCEFAQRAEWNHDRSLDWHLLDQPRHRGMQALMRDLNHFYKATPALYARDCEPEGFEWLDSDAADTSVYAFLRRGTDAKEIVVILCNFTPVIRYDFRVAVPENGFYREAINTDSAHYGGSDSGNQGGRHADAIPHHGRPYSLALNLPPLSTLILRFEG